ncbi:MAG: N-acetylmuramoyl-L-alanine amidase [Dehalococcoidia bacterium]
MKYEKALWRPITTNHRKGRTRGAATVQAFVCHSQEGYGSLFTLFNNPARRASTHFWIAKTGQVEQYVDTADTAWGNGERNRSGGPDARIPWAAAAYAAAAVNDVTVSCELEGRAGEPMTPEQKTAALLLLRWVHERHGLGQPVRHLTVVEHNQLSATACPSSRWPIDELLAPSAEIPVPPGSEVAAALAFWYPGLPADSALARFINQTILNDINQFAPSLLADRGPGGEVAA